MENISEFRVLQHDSTGSESRQPWHKSPAWERMPLRRGECSSCSERPNPATNPGRLQITHFHQYLLKTCSGGGAQRQNREHTCSPVKAWHTPCPQHTSAMRSPSPILSPSFFSQRAMVPICIVGDSAGNATCGGRGSVTTRAAPTAGSRSTGQGGTAGRARLPSPGRARPPAGAGDRRARRYGMGLTKGAGGAAENGPKGAKGTAGGTGAQGTQAGRVEGLQLLRCNPERGEAAGSPGAGSSHLLVCRQAAAAARHEPRPAGRRQQLAGPSCRTAARSHGAPRRCPTAPGGAERSAAPRQPRGPRGYAPREHPPHAGAGAAAAAPTPLGDLLRPGAAPHGSHDAAALP